MCLLQGLIMKRMILLWQQYYICWILFPIFTVAIVVKLTIIFSIISFISFLSYTFAWHVRKVGLETRDFWLEPRPETHLMGGTRDPRPLVYVVPKTPDPGLWTWIFRIFSYFSSKHCDDEWIHVLYAFMFVLHVFITRSYNMNTFNLSLSYWVTLSQLFQKHKFNVYHAAVMES